MSDGNIRVCKGSLYGVVNVNTGEFVGTRLSSGPIRYTYATEDYAKAMLTRIKATARGGFVVVEIKPPLLRNEHE